MDNNENNTENEILEDTKDGPKDKENIEIMKNQNIIISPTYELPNEHLKIRPKNLLDPLFDLIDY